MSTFHAARPRTMVRTRRFVVVSSQFNAEYVRGLTDHFLREIEAVVPATPVVVHEVPGAFEIPLAVQEVAELGGVDAIIAFGVIIQGATAHAQLIATSVTGALQSLALKYRIPIIHEVLLVQNEDQARERCLESEMNRGTDAARSAIRMIQVLSEIKARP